METRTEHDLLGERSIPADALYGIHTIRAAENFPLSGRRTHPALIAACGQVKLACIRAAHAVSPWPQEVYAALQQACEELTAGQLDQHILVDALQGGAGTSTNMNVNEVLANRTLELLGRPHGAYDAIHPLDDLNRFQSTNDTYPTALRVAAITLLRELEPAVTRLQEAFQQQEKQLHAVVKVGRTEMQDAVLTTLGRQMGAYAEAFSRDRWRVFKCEERLRTVNLGGTAIGTGLGAPRDYIFRAAEELRTVTGLGLARAENLVEATQNADPFVEVSGILKALAATLIKTASDLRLLSSGPQAGIGELRLPARQAGSSIMPGKVNPVIPEAVTQAALVVMGNDQALTMAAAMGNLELNAFMPLIADTLLGSLALLTQACTILAEHCVAGLTADRAACAAQVDNSTAALTGLVSRLGYETVQQIADKARTEKRTVADVAVGDGHLTGEEYAELISPEKVMQLGSRLERGPHAENQ